MSVEEKKVPAVEQCEYGVDKFPTHDWGRWFNYNATMTIPLMDWTYQVGRQRRSCVRCGLTETREIK